MKTEVTTRLSAQAAEFCDTETQKLVARLNRWLDRGGDYFEKQLKFCVRAIFSLDFVSKYFKNKDC